MMAAPMIYLYLDADEYLAAERIADHKASLGDPEMASLNMVELSGATATPSALMAEASMMPFLSDRRLVVVRGLLETLDKRMGASKSPESPAYQEAAQFLTRLHTIPETCILVLVDNSVDKRRALWKGFVQPTAGDRPERKIDGIDALIKAKVIEAEALATPDPKTLPSWLQARARTRNIAIEGGAVAVLCDFVGSNLRQLDNELEKLALYADGRPITPQDVRTMVSDASEEMIWNLTDALAQRQPAKAMQSLHELQHNDQNPIGMLSAIVRQYRMLIEIKSLMAAGQTNKFEIAKQLGYAAFPVEKAMRLVNQYTFEELDHAMERLLDADVAMKSGSDQNTEIDVLVAELSVRRQHPPVRAT